MSINSYNDQVSLVQGLLNREEAALNRLYVDYGAALNGIIKRIVVEPKIAEEVLQDVIIKIWNKIDQYDSAKGRFFTWMMQLSRNAAKDKLRSREISQLRKTDQLDNIVSNVERRNPVEMHMQDIGVRRLVDSLREEERQVIELVYFKGYTQSEAAKEIPLPLGTVKTRLRMAMKNLRSILVKE
ncbi:MAG: sigma-70 family RNA polymerase sigma factor [Eudoraea sp.]|nr:sigma-70 family RNA polymerase sigma factor [Eudoraea sp.]